MTDCIHPFFILLCSVILCSALSNPVISCSELHCNCFLPFLAIFSIHVQLIPTVVPHYAFYHAAHSININVITFTPFTLYLQARVNDSRYSHPVIIRCTILFQDSQTFIHLLAQTTSTWVSQQKKEKKKEKEEKLFYFFNSHLVVFLLLLVASFLTSFFLALSFLSPLIHLSLQLTLTFFLLLSSSFFFFLLLSSSFFFFLLFSSFFFFLLLSILISHLFSLSGTWC